MAKFFLTNNAEWYQKTKELISNSDFHLAFDYVKDGLYALTTHKLKIDNINAWEMPNGDFVIATGTAVYKESLDSSFVLQDFNGDIETIREHTIGQYAYTIHKGSNITIFNDGMGCYDVYYFIKDGYYYISNFLYDMAMVLRTMISINELNIIENALRRAIFCEETCFNEIKSLNGDEYITISTGNVTIHSLPYNWAINKTNAIQAAHILSQKLAEKAKVLYKVFGNPEIYMTGGLDSRMSLAAFLKNGAKPTLSYGLSNTHIAYPDKEDADIVHQFATMYGLRDNVMEWDTRYPDREWDKYLKRYGFQYEYWCGTDCMMQAFENSESLLCTFGLGGEMYRSTTMTSNREFLLDEIIINTNWMWNKELGNYAQDVRSHMERKIQKIAKKYGIDLRHIKLEEYFYFDKEVRRHTDAGGGMANLLNLIRYCDILLLERELVCCARIPVGQLENAQLMLRTMHELYPHILEIPIHSHHELHRFDAKNMTMISVFDSRRTPFEMFLKKCYHLVGKGLWPLRQLYKLIERRILKLQTESVKIQFYSSEAMKSFYTPIETSFCKKIVLREPSLAILHTMDLKAIDSIVKSINDIER